VERGIAGVELMRHFVQETLVGEARPRDLRLRSQEAHRLVFISNDSSHEFEKRHRSGHG
jgi:hypothetical protein